jgi:excisionase family DNA binding protein
MKLLTIKEVVDRTAISRRTLYRMIERGVIGTEDTFKIGYIRKKRVFTEKWVNDFIKSQMG